MVHWSRRRNPGRNDLFLGEKLKGTGSGKKLVRAAVEYARQRNLKIRPTCPFAKSVLSTEEFADILA